MDFLADVIIAAGRDCETAHSHARLLFWADLGRLSVKAPSFQTVRDGESDEISALLIVAGARR